MKNLRFNCVCLLGCFVFFNNPVHAENGVDYTCNQSGLLFQTMFMKHQQGQSQEQFSRQTDLPTAKRGLEQTFHHPKMGKAYGSFLQKSFDEAFSKSKIPNFSQRMQAAEQFRQNKVVQCKQQLSALAHEIAKAEVTKKYASRTGVKSIYGPYEGGFDDIFDYDVKCNNATSGGIVTDYSFYKWINFDKESSWHTEYNLSVDEVARRICK